MLEQHGVFLHQRDGGVQRMGLAAQRQELVARRIPVDRLGEALRAERQRLVGAEHQACRPYRCDGARLLARQQGGDDTGIA